MDFNKALDFYKQQRRKIIAQNYVGFVSSWDMETEAKENSILAESEQMAVLSELSYTLTTDPNFEQAVNVL